MPVAHVYPEVELLRAVLMVFPPTPEQHTAALDAVASVNAAAAAASPEVCRCDKALARLQDDLAAARAQIRQAESTRVELTRRMNAGLREGHVPAELGSEIAANNVVLAAAQERLQQLETDAVYLPRNRSTAAEQVAGPARRARLASVRAQLQRLAPEVAPSVELLVREAMAQYAALLLEEQELLAAGVH